MENKKKYQLIKEYPGSPKKDFILNNTWSVNYPLNCYLINGLTFNPENHKEFWEEVIEKDYEILSFQNLDNKCIYTLNGGKYHHLVSDKSLEYCLKFYKIHSVKRLSDGEIFTIGDNTSSGIIQQIHLDDKKDLWLDFPSHGGYSSENYKNLKKFKTPLFTTEDGVDIFKDNYFIFVRDTEDWSTDDMYATDRDTCKKHKRFSTKEKAEEYILMNKPCLSLKDIITTCDLDEFDSTRLKKLVKTKLKL